MGTVGLGHWVAAILIPAMLFASWNDYRRHRVPNWLNLSILCTGVALHAWMFGWSGVGSSFQGVGVGFGCLFVFWMMRVMGAGDVKFMAAVGAWLGPAATFQAVLVGGLVGGVLAIGVIAYQKNFLQTYMNMGVVMRKVGSFKSAFGEDGSYKELSLGGTAMPYAIPLTIGTLCVLVSNFYGWGGLQ